MLLQPVLILVLVEHTLGGALGNPDNVKGSCLNPCFSGTYSRRLPSYRKESSRPVLILVLVEHTLGVFTNDKIRRIYSLNPCFSGTYSRRAGRGQVLGAKSLNPCFSGTYSRRAANDTNEKALVVLILVLVEHTLGEGRQLTYSTTVQLS